MRIALTILFLIVSIVSNASISDELNFFDDCSRQSQKKSDRKNSRKKQQISEEGVGEQYENLNLVRADGKKDFYRIALDKKIVRLGEEFNIKVVFDKPFDNVMIYRQVPPKLIGSTNSRDIAKKELIVTHKADSLSTYVIYISRKGSTVTYYRSLIVVSDEMYDEVKKQEAEVISTGDKGMLARFYSNLSMHLSSEQSSAQMGNTFEYLSIEGKGGSIAEYKMLSDRTIIASGDSVRLKIVFDPKVVSGVEVEGVGETTAEDVAQGKFEVKMAPEKTSVYNVYIFKKDGTYVPMCGRVIVVAPDEYEAAQKQERILKLSSKRDELYLYYDRLAGGSIVELMKK